MIKKILIIDDSLLARMAVKKCLADEQGLEISEAQDGVQGVAAFRETLPDLTFCDLTMPNMSGFEALAEMKKIREDALIIILTADGQKKTLDKVMEAGAFMVINKPPRKEAVLDAIAQAGEAKKA